MFHIILKEDLLSLHASLYWNEVFTCPTCIERAYVTYVKHAHSYISSSCVYALHLSFNNLVGIWQYCVYQFLSHIFLPFCLCHCYSEWFYSNSAAIFKQQYENLYIRWDRANIWCWLGLYVTVWSDDAGSGSCSSSFRKR